MPITALGDNYNAEFKEALWEHVFNIDHLQKNRQRKQNSVNTDNEKNKITLEYGISSDGHMVSVLFSAETIEMLPETNDDEQLAPRSVDISRWKRGTYRLNKEPVGFKIDDLFIGVDPSTYNTSFRDLVTAVDVSHEHIINKQTTKGHTFSISNGDCRVRSGFAWATQVELNRRCQYGSDGIQKWYDLIPSPNVTGCSDILSYIQIISISHVQ
ncbi:hypothetical protein RMATCC62417_01119 [Rhizopus microsporus]|nr:hypothetical protein RMATCC62417_01119 [Rhizopus microsporus]